MDSSKPEDNAGKIWVFVAFGGGIGRSRLAVCVDFMVVLFGRSTWIPIVYFLMFKRGVSKWR